MGEPTRNYSNSNNKQTNKYWNIKEISEAERYIEYKFVERRFASVAGCSQYHWKIYNTNKTYCSRIEDGWCCI